ncbi:MAG TPA: class I SAM-dependent methyltransferase [Planctomycetota bacterium]|nr:class I SAM-dependent methyltransferase [Planctomycetota bacterium]
MAHEPDLPRYYRDYPFARRKLDTFTRIALNSYVVRLRTHGLKRHSRVLDYGCGSGILVDLLKEQNYSDVFGYDPYSVHYDNKSVLDEPYDFVIAQDVIEHDSDPRAFLATVYQYLKPGGILVVGTPRADAIDLARPEESLHALHAPFHLHIFSEAQLKRLVDQEGFELQNVIVRHCMDTVIPFLNTRFLARYLRSQDNTIDAVFDPPDLKSIILSPSLWIDGLFGYWLPRDQQDMIFIVKRP